mmetsp:Transcript_17880/g.52113  ORF Transcript_17880/g.52113 Transcript_17880/m.52113 type:complete len:273 (+) Transcript_17880:242-1060(+)
MAPRRGPLRPAWRRGGPAMWSRRTIRGGITPLTAAACAQSAPRSTPPRTPGTRKSCGCSWMMARSWSRSPPPGRRRCTWRAAAGGGMPPSSSCPQVLIPTALPMVRRPSPSCASGAELSPRALTSAAPSRARGRRRPEPPRPRQVAPKCAARTRKPTTVTRARTRVKQLAEPASSPALTQWMMTTTTTMLTASTTSTVTTTTSSETGREWRTMTTRTFGMTTGPTRNIDDAGAFIIIPSNTIIWDIYIHIYCFSTRAARHYSARSTCNITHS